MNVPEGLLICPFGVRTIYPSSGITFSIEAALPLHPPYRLLLHGEVRPHVLVRRMLFDGKSASASAAQYCGQTEPAVGGEFFGPLLLPFWAPECPVGGKVEMDVENASAGTIVVAATLFASPTQRVVPMAGVTAPPSETQPNYWR